MNFLFRKVATEGCEIVNENGQVVAWGINSVYSELIARALEMYLQEEKEEK